MALINVTIKFGDEYFCFGIYFFKTFFKHFFFKFFFRNFFPKIFGPNFFLKIVFQTFFQNFFFFGFSSQYLPVYRDKADSMYLCYEKYDKQAVEIGL